jgi:hypothetical protein
LRSSDGAPTLDRDSVELLLQVLEMPEPVLSGIAMHDHYATAAAPLIAGGLLKALGHEAVDVAAEQQSDTPVPLSWASHCTGLGYFSPQEGWVAAQDGRLVCYRADPVVILKAALVRILRPNRLGLVCWIDDHLWEVGDVRLGRLRHPISIWFARRLDVLAIWNGIKDAARSRPPARQRLILTSTAHRHLPAEALPGHSVVSLSDVITHGKGLLVDPDVLAGRLERLPERKQVGPISVLAEGREVRLYDQVFSFPRGVHTRAIIRLLFERYEQGERWVSSDEIISELELDPKTRIRDLFKHKDKRKSAWGRLLKERDGMCGFCIDE